MLIATCPMLAAGEIVYESNWEKAGHPGPEWSTERVIEYAPNGARLFLGGIRDQTEGAELRLRELPQHKLVRIEFDLILRGHWDGAHEREGPDRVVLRLDARRTLMDSSFAVGTEGKGVQSYPYHWESGLTTPAGTGAVSSNSLGYLRVKYNVRRPADATYHLRMVVPHRGDEMTLRWGANLVRHDKAQQWFGIDKVRITTEAEESRPGDAQWKEIVDGLRGDDPISASRSFWSMMECPERARAFGDSVTEVIAPARLEQYLADLVAEEFQKRQNAADRLLNLPSDVVPQIEAMLAEKDDDELRSRANRIIAEIKKRENTPSRGDYWREHVRLLLDEGEVQRDDFE